MKDESADRLLERVAVLGTRCDLDLLIFFARHPRVLLTSEQLATWLGYGLKQIAASLDVMQEAELVKRTQNPTHAARLYRFRPDSLGPNFRGILDLARTLEGRRQIRQLLIKRQPRPRRTTPRTNLSNVTEALAPIKEKAHG